MRTDEDLHDELVRIDRRGYPAYKDLRGAYDFNGFVLSIDHVQGDPFAAPSKLSVYVPARVAGLPAGVLAKLHRRVAVEDLLVRRLGRALARESFRAGGSGKSGLLATSRPGPEVLARSACEVSADGDVTLRFEAGLPAHGRTVDGRAADHMLLDLVPGCVEDALLADDTVLDEAQAAADLADDQHFIRSELNRLELVAFVADGSVLPRESGVSARPLRGATPFASPESLRVTLDLPHRGVVSGMGIRRGVTLVVGGGYHGKSTLLRAVQEGVYDHVEGDGRELVITDASAVKLRAEDGRSVRSVDISLFITNLPDGRDTRRFSTLDASGSTSQAAGAVEAVEAGCRALLIDEDTSATNFMVRDRLMEAVVAREHEPITPFVERVRDLWETAGVSSVIVAGSSGAFFSVADTVVQMDCYEAHDITEHACEVCRKLDAPQTPRAAGFALPGEPRRVALDVREARDARGGGDVRGSGRGGHGGYRGRGPARSGRGGGDLAGGRDERIKVKTFGRDTLQVGGASADLRLVEQLLDAEQVSALGQLVREAARRGLLDGSRTMEEVADELFASLRADGWATLSDRGTAGCGLTLPRPLELTATLNRLRL